MVPARSRSSTVMRRHRMPGLSHRWKFARAGQRLKVESQRSEPDAEADPKKATHFNLFAVERTAS
jgi:hypothetical protein